MLHYSSISNYFVLLLKLVLVVSVTVLLALAGGIYWLSSESGKAFVQDKIENQLSQNLGYQIKAKGISFNFPLTVKIEQISLLDSKGIWLETNDISVHLLPNLKIRDHLVFRKITANQLVLLRTPEINSSTNDAGNLDVSVLKVDITKVVVASSVTQLKENLTGSLLTSVSWLSSSKKLIFETEIKLKEQAFGLQHLTLNSSGYFLLEEDLLTVTSLSLTSSNLNVLGNGKFNLSTNKVAAALHAEKINISQWSDNVNGALQVDIAIAGTIQNPIVETTVTLHDATYLDQIIPNTVAIISSRKDAQKWFGDVSVKLTELDQASLQYEWSNNIVKLDHITGSYSNNSLNGSLRINTITSIVEGNLNAKIPKIEEFQKYMPKPLYGSVAAVAKLQSKNDQKVQAASVSLDFQNIELEQAKASLLQVQMEFDNFWKALPNTLKVTLSKFIYRDISADKVSFTSLKDHNKWVTQINAAGGSIEKFNISTIGDINFKSKDNWNLALVSLKGNYQNIPFVSKTNITAINQEDQLTLSASDLIVDKGRCSIYLHQTKETIKATLNGIDIPLFGLYASKSTILNSANANINLDIDGSLSLPHLELKTEVTNVKLNSSSKLSNIKFNATLHNGKAVVSAAIADKSKINSSIELNLPIRFSLDPIGLTIDKTTPIEGDANIALSITNLSRLFLSPEHVMKGDLVGKLKISGSSNSPQFFGNIGLQNGSYTYLPMHLSLNKTSFILNADDKTININDFSAEDAKGNKISTKGNINFSDLNRFEYKLSFATKEFELFNHPNAYGIISGNINLKGNEKSGEINGTLKSDMLEIHLPDRIIQNIPELNIVATVPNSSKQSGSQYVHPPYLIALDIGLEADHKVFVRGWGLDVELQGRLSLNGNTSNPEISGKLSSIRGRYEEFGKQFKLKQAELLFEGSIPPSPFLNIVSTTTQSDIEIEAILSGSVTKPSLKIESIPAMPQEDALSILLFGKTATKITLMQAIQLASSLKKLLGQGDDTINPLGEIRNLIGVDNISVNNNPDNQDTSVSVGKYIGEKIYFEIEKGAQAGSEKAHIEIEISPHVSVESGTSATSDSSLGVNWKYEY